MRSPYTKECARNKYIERACPILHGPYTANSGLISNFQQQIGWNSRILQSELVFFGTRVTRCNMQKNFQVLLVIWEIFGSAADNPPPFQTADNTIVQARFASLNLPFISNQTMRATQNGWPTLTCGAARFLILKNVALEPRGVGNPLDVLKYGTFGRYNPFPEEIF